MPIAVHTTRYVCSFCDTGFPTEEEARICEEQKQPENGKSVGDELTYDVEENFGVRWSYSCDTTIILNRKCVRMNSGKHGWAYEVQPTFGSRRYAVEDPEKPGRFFSSFDWVIR